MPRPSQKLRARIGRVWVDHETTSSAPHPRILAPNVHFIIQNVANAPSVPHPRPADTINPNRLSGGHNRPKSLQMRLTVADGHPISIG